jgi:predicted DNA-binding protein (MmcQ/YjbR family)
LAWCWTRRPDWAEVALLVRESYQLVATAKLRKALDAAKGQAL